LYQFTTYDEHRSQTNVVAAGGVEQNDDGEWWNEKNVWRETVMAQLQAISWT